MKTEEIFSHADELLYSANKLLTYIKKEFNLNEEELNIINRWKTSYEVLNANIYKFNFNPTIQ